MSKKIINIKKALIIVVILNIFFGIKSGYAYEKSFQNNTTNSKLTVESVASRYEKVRWYYREVNGKKQKRLWSLTAGEWLTEWEWV